MANEIDYNAEEFKKVNSDKQAAINQSNKTYDDMINKSDKFYQDQVNAVTDYEKKQTELQNEKTDFAIKEIDQKKDQAKQDYTKEQSGAYADWKKQSAKHGVNAEQIADQGLQNTGYSESAQVSMYNTYQNRVATARESFNRIILDFDNAITQARLQNNAALAEIAYNSLQQRLNLNMQSFQYKNQLLIEKANKQTELDQQYYTRWKDVLDQKNTERAFNEEQRQFNEQMAEQQRQFNYKNKLGEFAKKSSGGGGSSYSGSSKKTNNQIEKDDGTDNNNDNKSSGNILPAAAAIDRAISKGATKDDVSNAISKAVTNGKITKDEASQLRKAYTPRGYTY